ncbi:MAG: hypothetical protein EPN17_05320 [Methylobacter sp.]|nr:MAG: hypothetical protein EPN17_05320 [Methylobacter sp.]
MTLLELVQAAQVARPKAFGKINEKRAVAIIQAALGVLNKTIKNTEEGEVVLPVLGTFVAKNVKVKKEGVQTTRRRVVFNAQKTKKKAVKAE